MHINPWFFPTLMTALLLFMGGLAFNRSRGGNRKALLFYGLGAIAAVPGALYVLYYLHWFDNWGWFYAFRVQMGSELLAGGLGFLPGLLAREWLERIRLRGVFALAGLVVVLVFVPHMKPVIAPLDSGRFEDRWSGPVCLQSTEASCALASLATLMHYQGLGKVTELELLKEAHTYRGGTEVWYLARAARRRGANTTFLFRQEEPAELPYPVIAGVNLGGRQGAGHFLAVLAHDGEKYLLGEPLEGPLWLSREELKERYFFSGFFMVVK